MFKRQAALLFLFLLFASFSVLIFFSTEVRVGKTQLKEKASQNLNHQVEMLKREIGVAMSDLQVMQGEPEIKHMLDGRGDDHVKEFIDFLLAFSKHKKIYDQIRLVDATGMEFIRINYNDGNPVSVPEGELQNKSHRYYFSEVMSLSEGEVYVSQLDLNVEKGEIELPYKPIIRFGTPVFDSAGKKRGALLLNFFGNYLIQMAGTGSKSLDRETMLLDREGEWIISPNPEENWSFMFPEKHIAPFKAKYPNAWKAISGNHSGQIENPNGIFSFSSISSEDVGAKKGVSIKIVSRAFQRGIFSKISGTFTGLLLLYAGIVGILLAFAKYYQSKIEEDIFEKTLSPVNLILTIGFSIFVSELLVMGAISVLPPVSPQMAGILDATLLVLLISPMLYFLILRPVTAKIKKEIKMREEYNRYFTAIEQSAETIVITDINGTIQYVNPGFEKVSGYTREEAIGNNPRVLKSGAHSQEFYRKLWDTILAGKVWEGHFINKRKDGSLYEEDVIISPVKNSEGKLINFVAVKHDISYEAMLNRARGYFTAITSHELNTPLTKLKLVEVLLKNLRSEADDPGKVDDVIFPLETAYADLERISSSTILLSSLSVAGEEKKMYAVHIYYAIVGCIDSMKKKIEISKRDIRVEVDTSRLPHQTEIRGNQDLIERAINEVLSNAAKFSKDGQKTVKVKGELDNGNAVISIVDNGLGIPADKLNQAMQPFFALENPMFHSTGSFKYQGGGLGLGLTITRMIMEYHEGRFEIETSEYGKGVTARLTFPIGKAE